MQYRIYKILIPLFCIYLLQLNVSLVGQPVPSCRQLVTRALSQRVVNQGFKLVPGRELFYGRMREDKRLSDVYLSLEPKNIPQIAKVLAQGQNPQLIEQKLRQHFSRNDRPLSLIDFLPEFAKTRINKKATCDGPNCWNATLNWHNPQVGEKYTTMEEIDAALSENYMPLPTQEILQFGDVIVYREKKQIIHTAIFLDQNIAWHKAGKRATRPWTFESFYEVTRQYMRYGNPIAISFYRFSGDGS